MANRHFLAFMSFWPMDIWSILFIQLCVFQSSVAYLFTIFRKKDLKKVTELKNSLIYMAKNSIKIIVRKFKRPYVMLSRMTRKSYLLLEIL